MNFYDEQERLTTPEQRLLVDEIHQLLTLCLAEAEKASKELHAQVDAEQSFNQRWDEAVVGGLRVWKEHFDNGLWRRVVGAVAQFNRQMDYYYTDTVSNNKQIEQLGSSLTLKAHALCDIQFNL